MAHSPSISVHNYLIDQSGIDWSATLSAWHWILPQEFTLWLVNQIADLFIIVADGSVHMLDVGNGSLEKVADNREDFADKLDQEDNANIWLAILLVDRLVAAGITLSPGQCYGFKKPPILGGEYTTENLTPLSITDHLAAYGALHEQLRDAPDGTQVVLKVVNGLVKKIS